ncbi:hypothetical protein FA13DRAFT_1843456 [Coprinellus micaceus]|uniref:CHAT domain-containing protein n=1 Tax=Coprinellus micaceus TaxID=71717 RepID=A0A4Y7SDI9_COPMI|nr:hypothetical protein FA13DRAFT_1843456 [Coprinellus micaceus]
MRGAPQSEDSLKILGDCLYASFIHTGHPSDLDGAISMFQRRATLTAIGHPSLPTQLRAIACLMLMRFLSSGLLTHVDEAASVVRTAIEGIPVGCADLPDCLCDMGIILMLRFKCFGCLSDRDEASKAHRNAVGLAGAGHQSFPSLLCGLADSLNISSNHTGDQLELEEGILLLQRAIDLTPRVDKRLATYHSTLGSMISDRFHSTNNILDATEQVRLLRRAVKAHQGSDKNILHDLLHRLALSLASLSEISGHLIHLEEAITTARKVVNLTSHSLPILLPSYMHFLGQLLGRRYHATGQLSDLDESLSILERVVEHSPMANHKLPDRLSKLGVLFASRYMVTHNAKDVEKAISNLEQAIKLTPPGHASLPTHYSSLGVAQLIRFWETAHLIENAHSNPSLAATFPVGDLNQRLMAAGMWALGSFRWLPNSPDILVALDTALGLLAMTAGLNQTIRSRHIQLQSDAPVVGATTAAPMALKVNRPDKALEWLEQGRCLIWNQINHLRTPLDNLHTHNPSLAERLKEVSRCLEIAGSSQEQPCADMPLRRKTSLQEESYAHANLAKEWEELLVQVRAIPTFESFLQPAKCSALLQDLPESGVIVVISVDRMGCDAIALLAGLDEPFHIPLPNFSKKKAEQHQRDLGLQLKSRELRLRKEDRGIDEEHSMRAGKRYRQPQGTPIRRVLRGLWNDVVHPILNMLAISQPGEEPPRIWWCPTGALSFLPLHAAGIYGPGVDSESILDYAVSSYTPTVSALLERVRNSRPIDNKVSGLFLTSQPNAPHTVPIPGTTEEVESIYKKAKGNRVFKVHGSDLTVDDCLNYLDVFSSVHFACHGYQNPEESLKSRFYFRSGTLDLGVILRKDLKNAELAFLSACQTSTGDEKLPEEAVHLAAGMLAAGYRRVVGTMWCIGDKTAQDVSMSFYDWLFDRMEPGSGFDGTLSAYALHHAIQKLRGDIGDTDGAILAWAPFVHWAY